MPAPAQGRAARSTLDTLVTAWNACTTTRGGAWMLLPDDASMTWTDGPVLQAHLRVSFIDVYGTIHVGPDAIDLRYEPAMEGHTAIALRQFFDFDGDGTTEVIVTVDEHYYEDTSHHTYLLAYADGAVATYGPAADIDVHAIEDADQDGRPDIVSIRRYWSGSEDCGESPPDEGTPPVLFRSLPDGSFSATGAVTEARLRAACPRPPTRLLSDAICTAQDARLAIACARLWGATTDEVLTRIASERAQLSDEARDWTDAHAFDAYAAVEPPLILHR